MQALGCADLQQLAPPAFVAHYQLGTASQYGMVCDNIQASVAHLQQLGAGPFFSARSTLAWQENNTTNKVQLEFALGYSNHQQIELLSHGKNTSFYSQHIPSDGSLALHHVCFLQSDLAAKEAQMNAAGFATLIAGNSGLRGLFKVQFRYLDTWDELGFYLELCEYKFCGRDAPPTEKWINRFAKLQRQIPPS